MRGRVGLSNCSPIAGLLDRVLFVDEFVKSLFHHGDHRDHRENIFNYIQLSLWALCSPWLSFGFYESIIYCPPL
jgi:hypothetical protein